MSENETSNIKLKADKLAHAVYDLTIKFPREELYGVTSQLSRAIISIPANIVEGYARMRMKVFLHHLEIAYGSLAEAKYFLDFAAKREFISKEEYSEVWNQAEEVSKILWSSMQTISQKMKD
jgi:four helix bundle protein